MPTCHHCNSKLLFPAVLPTLNVAILLSHVLPTPTRLCEFYEFGCTACFWPRCLSEKWADGGTHTKQARQPRRNTLKTPDVSHIVLMSAPCREHSVSGKGVIFTAVFSVQSQQTWQSQSLLIGLMLGDLLQNFIPKVDRYIRCYDLLCKLSPHMLL